MTSSRRGASARGAAVGRTPVNEFTLFEIGSSTKACTATAEAMMVSDSKCRYNHVLSKCLSDFRLADPVASARWARRKGKLAE